MRSWNVQALLFHAESFITTSNRLVTMRRTPGAQSALIGFELQLFSEFWPPFKLILDIASLKGSAGRMARRIGFTAQRPVDESPSAAQMVKYALPYTKCIARAFRCQELSLS